MGMLLRSKVDSVETSACAPAKADRMSRHSDRDSTRTTSAAVRAGEYVLCPRHVSIGVPTSQPDLNHFRHTRSWSEAPGHDGKYRSAKHDARRICWFFQVTNDLSLAKTRSERRLALPVPRHTRSTRRQCVATSPEQASPAQASPEKSILSVHANKRVG